MPTYTSKKESAEYSRILNVSEAMFMVLGHFDKHFVRNTRKRGLSGKHGVFSLRYS